MFPSQLNLASGKLPAGRAFDISDASLERGWSPSVIFVGNAARVVQEGIPKTGTFVIDYPFEEPCARLGGCQDSSIKESAGQSLEVVVRRAIDATVDALCDAATKVGCNGGDVRLVITELLKNATQYGSVNGEVRRAGLVSLEWSISEDPHDPRIAITVSNPVTQLFDPSRYCRMSPEDYLQAFLDSIADDGPFNGHGGAKLLAGLAKPGTHLTYLWDLEDGGHIMVTVKHSRSPEQEGSDNADSDISDFIVETKRFGGDRKPIEGYDLVSFDKDVTAQIPVRSFTVACVIGAPRIS